VQRTIALFGEAEKGEFKVAHFCDTLSKLVDQLGHPPKESLGLHYAVQTLLYQHTLIYYRIKEEGFSFSDYLWGFHHLEQQKILKEIVAICIPGVGDSEIIQSATPLCLKSHGVLIITEPDLYDFLHG